MTAIGPPDLHSLPALRAAFRKAPEPALSEAVGEWAAHFIGPLWLRAIGPPAMALGRMPGWCGKRFGVSEESPDELAGVNLVRSRGVVGESIPMSARLAASVIDARPAVVIAYPRDAPFPWPRVRDELRVLDQDQLIGMTFGIPLTSSRGTPFLLRRG